VRDKEVRERMMEHMENADTLAEQNQVNRELAQQDRQLAFTTYPESIYPILLRPCKVNILMVTDGGGSFGNADFGLRALLDALAVSPGPWVRFAVTKAHRETDSTANLQNFRFDTANLDSFDEIWLFGVQRTFGGLTDGELRALAQFMDGGGGVFATGDHEDLGLAMSGRVPRVRSMRKWHWPNPGPNGEPVAPRVDGPDRFDTLRAGGDPGYQFDDQSDDVPQVISPKLYSSRPYLPVSWLSRVHPHPLLCSPRGVIRVLPDHAHEGECYEPADLTASFTFDGYTTEEYPALPNGTRLGPEVIAWSTVIGGRSAADIKGPVNPRSFGAIGAYNGHRVGTGRVVVDATWHHFFNINLVGEMGSAHPIKSLGFAATPQGLAAYEDIKDYFRNIAVYLARSRSHACMRWRALWLSRWYHQLLIEFRPSNVERGIEALELDELLRIGTTARDVLGRLASQCQSTRWALDLLEIHRPNLYKYLETWIDPVVPRPEPDPDPAPWVYANMLLDAALGGTLYAIAAEFPEPNDEARERAEEAQLEELIGPGVDVAVNRVREAVHRSHEELERMADTLEGV
jgi:hypothetical protein